MDRLAPNLLEWTSKATDETQRLAERIGRLASEGMVIALVGELGSGKTAFVQGLARGLEVPDHHRVTSPSFTIINEYPGRCRLIHIDLYRIETGEDLHDLGLVELLHGSGVAAVEWSERLQHGLPGDRLTVELKIIDDETRRILIRASGSDSNRILQKIEI